MELPPLNSLRLFAIVARCGSFKLAAQELNRTPGAVSQGIKSLEEWLNVALFDRRKPELVLTPAGHDYLPYINDALSKIAQGTDEILPNNRNSHDTPAIEGGDAEGAATATRFQPVVLDFPGT
jgi:LysR family transcriptional regulator, glycine cleavage system transcriptional activator